MRHLILCCDGTWSAPDQQSVSNVARLYHALAAVNEQGNDQVREYQRGVGTAGGVLDWLLGGGFGVGLTRDILAGYHWLTTTYQPGDRIALFGWSRGAFTVRSIAGMIAACGLIDTTGLDEDTTWRRIQYLYECRYRLNRRADPGWDNGLNFTFDPEHADDMPVHFIGVWDTVGALGIPETFGVLNLLDPPRRHNFHDLKLNPHVQHARHAVAMDEFRAPFAPTLWTDPAPNQDVKQVWFPGSHLDVGGGHPERGLSDRTLQWMIDEAHQAGGLAFDKTTVDQIRPDAGDVLHDDNRSVAGFLAPAFDPLLQYVFEPRPRAIPLISPHNPAVDESVLKRAEHPLISSGPYRPTRQLAVGESATVEVQAREPWNWTQLYLDVGDYTFSAHGEWQDGHTWSGPAGSSVLRLLRRLRSLGVTRLLGTLSDQGERLFRRVTGNEVADFLWSRREPGLPWMSLVGVVANDAKAIRDAPNLHERIPIGTGTNHHVRRAGYLYAFANNTWGSYHNNRGSMRLRVTRAA